MIIMATLTQPKLFETRLRIVHYIILLRADDEESDVAIWKWLRDLLTKLGSDGMSSDDSDIDDRHRKIYRVTFMAWRRPEITGYMEYIDMQRDTGDHDFSEQGADPRTRVRSLLSASSGRKPVKRLPRNLYDNAWFEKNHRKMSVNVSKEQFQWLSVAATTQGR
jgi:hypothetical protein